MLVFVPGGPADLADRFHAGDQVRVRLARPERVRGDTHSLQARCAEPVDGAARNLDRKPGEQAGPAGQVGALLPLRVRRTEGVIGEQRGIDTRPGHSGLDRGRDEVVGSDASRKLPLTARPMGVRTAVTISASGMIDLPPVVGSIRAHDGVPSPHQAARRYCRRDAERTRAAQCAVLLHGCRDRLDLRLAQQDASVRCVVLTGAGRLLRRRGTVHS